MSIGSILKEFPPLSEVGAEIRVTTIQDLDPNGRYILRGRFKADDQGAIVAVLENGSGELIAIPKSEALNLIKGRSFEIRDGELIELPAITGQDRINSGEGFASASAPSSGNNGWFWITGSRACSKCAARNGVFFPLSRAFKPLHDDCMCAPEYTYVPNPDYGTEIQYPISLSKNPAKAEENENLTKTREEHNLQEEQQDSESLYKLITKGFCTINGKSFWDPNLNCRGDESNKSNKLLVANPKALSSPGTALKQPPKAIDIDSKPRPAGDSTAISSPAMGLKVIPIPDASDNGLALVYDLGDGKKFTLKAITPEGAYGEISSSSGRASVIEPIEMAAYLYAGEQLAYKALRGGDSFNNYVREQFQEKVLGNQAFKQAYPRLWEYLDKASPLSPRYNEPPIQTSWTAEELGSTVEELDEAAKAGQLFLDKVIAGDTTSYPLVREGSKFVIPEGSWRLDYELAESLARRGITDEQALAEFNQVFGKYIAPSGRLSLGEFLQAIGLSALGTLAIAKATKALYDHFHVGNPVQKEQITKMQISDMIPINLKNVTDEEVLQAWHRLNQLYALWKGQGRATEDLINAGKFVLDEFERRGFHHTENSLAEATEKLEKANDTRVEVTASDKEHRLQGLLNYIKHIGNTGHSFSIVVDPDNSEYTKRFRWDGDGSDRISEICVNGSVIKGHDGVIPHPISKALESLPQEVVLVPNFVSLVGSAVKKEDPGDIDVLFRALRDESGNFYQIQKDNIWLPVRNALDLGKGIHAIDNPQGAHADHLPLYSLILRKEEPMIRIVKEDAGPLARFAPEKPLMLGYTDFFSVNKELWPWCQKKLAQGAVLAGEIKFDGFRCILAKDHEKIEIWFEDSGQNRADKLPALVELARKSSHPSFVLDGELLATKDGKIVPRTQLMEMLGDNPNDLEPCYVAFDALYMDGEDLKPRLLDARQRILKAMLESDLKSPLLQLSKPVRFHTEKELEIAWKWASSQPASEGIVIKDLNKPYHEGGSDDWSKAKTVLELKVQVLKVEKVSNGYTYNCALDDPASKNGLYPLGKTFVTPSKIAGEGQVINVRIEELLVLQNEYGFKKYAWGKPTVVGPDSSRRAYTVSQALDLAKRGHVLKQEVKKEFVFGTGPTNVPIAFVAASPSILEGIRHTPLVGQAGRIFKEHYLDPLGLDRDHVLLTYVVPEVLKSDGRVRAPSQTEIDHYLPSLLKALDDSQPQMVVALGRVAKEALGDRAALVLPHPLALINKGDRGEVTRKLGRIKKVLGSADTNKEDEPRSAVASQAYSQNWQTYIPKSGKGTFVLQAHWRGLSEAEIKLTHEELLKTDHSVHCDLRLEIDGETLWGFTIFEGKTSDIHNTPHGARILSLPASDSLQGTFKLPQPHSWLEITDKGPYISEPKGVGATSKKYAKFFRLDGGEYDLSYAREHARELFMRGSHLTGRLLIQFALMGGHRVWIISRPEDQTPFTANHKLEEVMAEIKAKHQRCLVWCDKPGDEPQILYTSSDIKKAEDYATILKADEDKQIVCGVVLKPKIFDLQGDRLSADEIRQSGEEYLKNSRVFFDRHRKPAKAELVKYWFVDKDQEVYGKLVKAGSWVLCVHVSDARIWGKIKRGEYTGFSVGGRGVRIPAKFAA